ncbi:C39 family peptidase [Brevibacterium sp. JNUCC-42]|nr:C39 family peptidase [Brevibacterium sp. JNUCC-42]
MLKSSTENPYVLINIEPLKNVENNCIEDVITSIARWLTRNHECMFVESWKFTFEPNENPTNRLGDQLIIPSNNFLALLQQYHGIQGTVYHTQMEDEMYEIIQTELTSGFPIVATMNSFWVPWDKNYQKEHTIHSFMIVGINSETRDLYCTDPYFMQREVLLSRTNFIKGYKHLTTFSLVHDEQINPEQVIGELAERLSTEMQVGKSFSDMEKFADVLLKTFDLQRETEGYDKNFDDIPLINNLADIANGRLQYAHLLSFISSHYYPNLQPFVEEMKKVGNNWNVIRGIVIKMHLTKRSTDTILEKLSSKIIEVSQDEKRFAAQLLDEFNRLLLQNRA